MSTCSFALGVKSDPILYRYSYGWLFRLMAEEGVHHLQLGTFCELYHLPDAFFTRLRAQAADHGIAISSVFTAHRELGGYFMAGDDQGAEWVAVARRNHERLIAIAGLLGARSAGHNPGAVPRDLLGSKRRGWDGYVTHLQQLLACAHRHGVAELTVEPMSCAAEPPTSPQEQRALMEALMAHHQATPGTAAPGYCVDVAHGWLGAGGARIADHWELIEAGLPWCRELHLKNTDARYDRTFGFDQDGLQRGIIDVAAVRAWLAARAARLPVRELVGYLEIPGPKLGRDWSDGLLEEQLRASLRHLRQAWEGEAATAAAPAAPALVAAAAPAVRIAPSLMCADQCHLAEAVRRLEQAGCDLLHVDLMDGSFAPNLPLGLEQLRQLRPRTRLPIDVHLMVEDNDLFVQLAAEAGADRICVHAESCRHLDRTLAAIRRFGRQAGVALNPATGLDAIRYVLPRLDYLLLMMVNPGFAGQQLVPTAVGKITEAAAFLRRHGRALPIAVDGNVSPGHIPAMVAAGADELVGGSSSVFDPRHSLAANLAAMRAAAAAGLAARAADPAASAA
jgi:ribulose-phosphate 3-epimerase